MAAGNKNLNSAKTARKDEFYTQLTDIEKEMRYYRKHFKDKTVLCNCDDPFESNFFKYFVLNFNRLGLDVAELFKSGENELTELEGDGDFRSPECLELRKRQIIGVYKKSTGCGSLQTVLFENFIESKISV